MIHEPVDAGTEKRKVLIVDDHSVVRQGLRVLIEGEADLTVCGAVGDVEGAVTAVERLNPDLALIDLSLGNDDGLSLIKDLHARWPDTKTLVLSMHSEAVYAKRCLRAGAHGYVMKEEPWRILLQAIRTVLDGRLWVSATVGAQLIHDTPDGGGSEGIVAKLSDRELAVFRLIGEGHGTREIAEGMGVSTKTVETFRERIKRKLDVRTGSELAQRAAAWVSRKTGSDD